MEKLSLFRCCVLVALLTATAPAQPPRDSIDRDYSGELSRIDPVEPKDALATFKLAKGFRLELAAHEPLVVDPIAMAFDEDGRLFVVEMRDYSEQADEHLGRIRLLTDTDGDGKFDKSSVYADGLSWPTAVFCWDGGVFVAASPDIWYCKDENGDAQADKKEKVFTGFTRSNVQGLVNSFAWGPDNRIHGATSSSGAMVRRVGDKDDKGIRLRGRDFSFDPRTLDLRAESGGGQHGLSFNDWGEKFVCSNSDHLQMVMFEDRYVARNPYWQTPSPRLSIAADGPQADVFRASPVEPWRVIRTRLRAQGIVRGPVERGGKASGYFTSATGVTIYRGHLFSPLDQGGAKEGAADSSRPAEAGRYELRDFAIVGDVGSNLVHRKRLDPHGIAYEGKRVDENSELIASTDIWFRPVQYANAPDGALYIADMYREVIEHPNSLPPVIKKHLDLTSGRDRGRIYRLVPEDFKQRPVPKLSQFTTKELVAVLDHSHGWQRDTAARLLYQRQDRLAIKPLKELAKAGESPPGRCAALCALAGMEALSPETILSALNDEDPHVRRQAVRLSEKLLAQSPAVRDKLCSMVDDKAVGVRYQLAFTLGDFSGPQRAAALAQLLLGSPQNSWIRLAAGTSLQQGSGAVLKKLVADEAFARSPEGSAAIQQIAAQIGRQQRADDVACVVQALAALAEAENQRVSAAILTGLNAAEGSKLRAAVDAASGGQASEQIKKLVAGAQARALNEKTPAGQRVDAVAQLRLGKFADLKETFEQLLAPEQPTELQTAALNAASSFDAPEVAELLIRLWPTFTPSTRSRAGDVLFSRQGWVAALVDAWENKRVPLRDFQQVHFDRIDARGDAKLTQRIARLLGERATASPRAEVVAKYQSALQMKGDLQRGSAAFAKHCAACHKVGGVGHEIGPNLAAMHNRGAEAILVNVLDPNREVNPQYVNYVAITKDGRSLSGLIAAETANSITLARGEGAKDNLLRLDIDELKSTGISLMPEGLEKQIDQQTMADLLAFLLDETEAP